MRRTSSTTRRLGRGGFTLPEAMIATVLVATSAAAVMTTMSASYQQQQNQHRQTAAIETGQQLLEVACLPLSGDASGDMSMDMCHGYTDIADAGTSSMFTTKTALDPSGFEYVQTQYTNYQSQYLAELETGGTNVYQSQQNVPTNVNQASVTTPISDNELEEPSVELPPEQLIRTTRTVHVKRMNVPGGPEDPTGGLALITVVATDQDNKQVTLRRLVSIADEDTSRFALKDDDDIDDITSATEDVGADDDTGMSVQ
jgi:Tfp pilus assembly major pilin PilA